MVGWSVPFVRIARAFAFVVAVLRSIVLIISSSCI
jgi:hypothetical protein